MVKDRSMSLELQEGDTESVVFFSLIVSSLCCLDTSIINIVAGYPRQTGLSTSALPSLP